MGQLQGVAGRRPCHRSATRRRSGVKESETPMSGGPRLMTLQLTQGAVGGASGIFAQQKQHHICTIKQTEKHMYVN